jgi:hypothetical protein
VSRPTTANLIGRLIGLIILLACAGYLLSVGLQWGFARGYALAAGVYLVTRLTSKRWEDAP